MAGRAVRGQPAFHCHAAGWSRDFIFSRSYDLFGHSQPFEQSLQQAHSHLQFGQSLQQSFVQQVPSLHVGSAVVADVEWLVKPAAARAAATNSPPKTLANMNNSLSWMLSLAFVRPAIRCRGQRPQLQKIRNEN